MRISDWSSDVCSSDLTECGIDIDVGGVIAQRCRRLSGIGGIALPGVTLSKVGLRRHAVTTLEVHIIKAALPMQRLVGVSNQADLGADILAVVALDADAVTGRRRVGRWKDTHRKGRLHRNAGQRGRGARAD